MLNHTLYLIELCIASNLADKDVDAAHTTFAGQTINIGNTIYAFAISIYCLTFLDFPSANNIFRNAGHEITVPMEGGQVKTTIVQLLVKLQYLPATPAEQKETLSRVSLLRKNIFE